MPPQELKETNVVMEHRSWIFSHPYVTITCAALILVAIGAVIVSRRLATDPIAPSMQAWGGSGQTLIDPEGYSGTAPIGGSDNPMGGAPYTYNAPDIPVPTGTAGSAQESDNEWSIDSIISFLSNSIRGNSAPDPSAKPAATALDLDDVYALLPTGLISTNTGAATRTAAQETLYIYGNEVGSTIQSFEDTHTNIVQVMKDQIEDPSDESKNAALARLGRDLVDVGEQLKGMETIPSQVKGMHAALADSYVFMGQNLQKIPGPKPGAELLNVINAYNASADVFVKHFVAIATLFSASGVTFSQEDPGSVFMFTYSGGF